MIKNSQTILNRIHIVLDVGIIVAAYALAYLLQFHIFNNAVDPSINYLGISAIIVPFFLVLYAMIGLYTPKRVTGRYSETGNVIKANVVGAVIIIAGLYLAKETNVSRMMLFYFALINTVLLVVERASIRYVLRFIRTKGINKKHVIVVGASRAAEEFIERVLKNPQWGFEIHGVIDDKYPIGEAFHQIKVLGKLDSLERILQENQLDEIIIALGIHEYEKLESIVKICEKSGVHTKLVPDYNNMIPTKPYTEDLLGLPIIHIRHVPLTVGINRFWKRTIDIVGSLFAIVLFSPLMLLCAILIKISSKGHIFFKQERVGLRNETFVMYKFRSMIEQNEDDEKTKWTTKGDSRTTKIGAFMRKTSIDELPQFFNVLKGDMSIVGPRPERPFYVDKFKEEIPRYMVKHQVRPGITGWAQVNGWRGDTSIWKRIDCDLYYIENWTIGFDFKIMFLTVFKGFVNKNAY